MHSEDDAVSCPFFGETISSQFLYLIASHNVRTPHEEAWTALLCYFELGVESCTSCMSSAGTYVLASKGSNRVQKKGPPGSCYGCGLLGHKCYKCPTNPYVKGQSNGQGGRAHKVKYDNSDVSGGNVLFTAICGAKVKNDKSSWVIDSGATRHITVDSNMLFDYHVFSVPGYVSIANGTVCTALGIGKLIMYTCVSDTRSVKCTLSDVLYVPNLSSNFFSVRAATLHGNVVKFGQSQCWISEAKDNLVGTGLLQDQKCMC